MNRYQRDLEERKSNLLLRSLPNSNTGIDFFSNDYLGFARSEKLSQKIDEEYRLSKRKNGATGSRLLSGNSDYAVELEAMIADFHGHESSLIFNSGYQANSGLIAALGKRGVKLVCDELIHASMIDGVRLSLADKVKFRHNDLKDLEKKLSESTQEKIVLVESVYSMNGDTCPLEEMLNICQTYNAEMIVDEAHAIGTIGSVGQGLVSKLGIQNDIMATVATFGKAMGSHGACVLGKKWLKDYLINFARPFIYSTAPSHHQLVAIKCAYQELGSTNEIDVLGKNIDYFITQKDKFHELEWTNSSSPIQSLIIPGNENVIEIASFLINNGIDILPIRSPTVKEGEERLRISLHAFNSIEEITRFFDLIEEWNTIN